MTGLVRVSVWVTSPRDVCVCVCVWEECGGPEVNGEEVMSEEGRLEIERVKERWGVVTAGSGVADTRGREIEGGSEGVKI